MNAECEHTLHHVDGDGRPQGSWTVDAEGIRIECGVCGSFYGYLPEGYREATSLPRVPPNTKQVDDTSNVSSEKHVAAAPPAGPVEEPAAPAIPLARPRRRGLDYKRLRDQVSMSQVLEFINFQPTARRGDQLRGACPVHAKNGSHSKRPRSFSVDVRGARFQCFNRACKVKGNQLDLWVAVCGLPMYDAGLALCEKAGIDPPFKELA